MFKIQSGVARPAPKRAGGDVRYPTADLEVGQYFIVPKSHMLEDDTPQKFRNRINQSVRTQKQRLNSQAHLEPDYDEASFVPRDYSVILLDAPVGKDQDWAEGDVGVWRDA